MSDSSDSSLLLHKRILETEAGESLSRCVSCGTCSSGCPVHSKRPEFDPRQIIRMILMGLEQELIDSGVIWLCSTCYTCLERCPQKVGCADIITELRNAASDLGAAPEGTKMQMDALRKQGRIYEIEDFDNKKRGKMGLAVLDGKAALTELLAEEEKDGEDAP